MSGWSEDRLDRDPVALHDVEDAVGEPCLFQELAHEERGGRVLLRRLEDEGVPAGDRGRPHPHGHHHGEVERRDARDDAERLADRVDVDPRRGLLRVLALEELRDAADVLDHLDAALHLAVRVGKDLAVLRGEEPGQIVAVLVDQLVDAEEELGSLREGEVAPARVRGFRRGDRLIDLLDRREVHLARLLARRRVVDGAFAARVAADALAPDPVPDRLQLRRHRCVHL